MDRDELILQKLSELAEDVKDLRKNVGGLQKDITDVKLQQADDRRRSETADMKVRCEFSNDVESENLTAVTDRVESKIDGVVANISERKADTNERWKIGGIIVSTTIAILALIKSFFLFLKCL